MVSPSGYENGALFVIVISESARSIAAPWPTSTGVSNDTASIVISEGANKSGAVVSTIVIFWLVLAMLAPSSVTVQVTTVSPSENS